MTPVDIPWYISVMTTAKVFMNGRSQAIRLPKEFRVQGHEVQLRRTSEGILICEQDAWDISRAACEGIPAAVLDALERRDRTPPQDRDTLPRV